MQKVKIDNWCKREFESVNFADKRLKERFCKIASSLGRLPESSINQACGDWSDVKGAYRFFQNDKVDAKNLLSGHVKSTSARIMNHKVILAIQDTSYIMYGKHKKTKGLSLLYKKASKDLEMRGLVMHTSFAVSSEGLALGILDQNIYTRVDLPESLQKKKESSHGNSLAVQDKESIRWLESMQNTLDATKEYQGTVVTVCDREGDMYDLYELASKNGTNFLIRSSRKNRYVNKKSRYSKDGERLYEVIQSFEKSGDMMLEVPCKDGKRVAKLEVSFGKFTMNPNKNNARHRLEKLQNINIHAVRVFENNPPDNTEGLEWILLTNIEVSNFQEALEKIRWYSLRWRIEVFHKILKSGLNVEKCRLSTADRLMKYLTIMSIIAWRIFYTTLISRSNPDIECTMILTEIEWKILYVKVHSKAPDNGYVPSVKEAIKWIAKLGGYLSRKSDPEPGPIVVWRGWRRLNDLIEGSLIYRNLSTCG